MDTYYDIGPDGLLKKVKRQSRETVGLKYISEAKAAYLSDGKYKKSGWLLSDEVLAPTHYARTDDLGTKGVFNPADGKTYDSRASYYRAVKEKGLVIIGDDAPKTVNKPKTKDIDWKQAVAETYRQLTPKKGKRK